MQRSGALGFILAPLLILLLFLVPLTGAQVPEPNQEFFGASIEAERSTVSIDYLSSANVNLVVEDISKTSEAGSAQPSNRILLEATVVGDPPGWNAYTGSSSLLTRPGDVHDVILNIQPTVGIEDPHVVVKVNATYVAPDGDTRTVQTSVLAVANPNAIVNLLTMGSTDDFRPDEFRRVPLEVSNQDYYPRMVHFRTEAPEDWVVSPPSSIQLAPGESRTVWIDVQAPQDPWFRLNPASAGSILVTAEMEAGESVSQQTVAISSSVTGFFLPSWVIPHFVLLAAGLFLFGRRAIAKRREYGLQKGKPSFPGLPPEKRARFEALKLKDPDRAEKMKTRLKKLHEKRKDDWKQHYKEWKKEKYDKRRKALRQHDAMLSSNEEPGQSRASGSKQGSRSGASDRNTSSRGSS